MGVVGAGDAAHAPSIDEGTELKRRRKRTSLVVGLWADLPNPLGAVERIWLTLLRVSFPRAADGQVRRAV